MENETFSISITEWKSFKESLPDLLQLRSNRKNGYKVRYHNCKDKCGFTMRVKDSNNMLYITLNNRDKHIESNENEHPNQIKERGICPQIKDIIIDLVEAHKYIEL
jgi:hypothetical protein